MRPLRHFATLLLAAALGLALTACGDQSPDSGGDPSGQSLDGDWVLDAGTLDGTDLDLGAGPVTLTIDGSRWSGSSACNQYFTDAQVSGSQVTIGAVGGTEMACEEPRMSLEQDYWAALARVATASADGDTLTLSGDGVELVFGPAPVEETADLIGTEWTLTSLIEGDAASSVIAEPATLTLHDDGTVTGSTGCRTFRGRWKTTGEQLVIGPLATPRIACLGASEPQDRHVLQVLDGEVTAVVDGQSLTVQRGSLGLVYQAG